MRLRTLTMQRFGSYKDKQVIDFDELGQQGLFLVTGPTGSGKTTIFDAISIALFNTSSGEERDFKAMICGHDNPQNEHTVVELRFEHHDRSYRVRREIWLSKQGNVQQPKAELEFEHQDRNPITNSTQVTQAIQEILGIGVDEFRQLIMIAQGNFQKVLKADAKSRRQLLSTLFNTKPYEVFQERLANEADELHKQVETHEHELEKLYIQLDEYHPQIATIKSQLISKQPSTYTSDALESALVDAAADVQAAQKTLSDERTSLKRTLEHERQRLEQLNIRSEAARQLEVLHGQITQVEDQFEEQTQAATRFSEQEAPQIDQLKRTIDELNRTKQTIIERDQFIQQLKELNAQRSTRQHEHTSRAEQLHSLTERLAHLGDVSGVLERTRATAAEDGRNLTQLKEVVQSYTQATSVFNDARATQSSAHAHAQRAQEALQALHQQHEQLEAHAQALPKLDVLQNAQHEAQLEVQTARRLVPQLSDLRKHILGLNEDWNQSQNCYERAQRLLNQRAEERQHANNELKRITTLFLDQVAVRLAQTLQEEVPCPVCGATHHPHVAKLAPHAERISEQDVELQEQQQRAAQKLFDEAQQQVHAAEAELSAHKASALNYQERLLSLEAELISADAPVVKTFKDEQPTISGALQPGWLNTHLEELLSPLTPWLHRLEAKLNHAQSALNAAVAELNAHEQTRTNLNKQIDAAQAQVQAAERALIQAESRANAAQERAATLEAQLMGILHITEASMLATQAEKKMQVLERKHEQSKAAHAQAQADFNEAAALNQTRTEFETQLGQLEQELQVLDRDYTRLETNVEIAQKQTAGLSTDDISQQLRDSRHQLEVLETKQRSLTQALDVTKTQLTSLKSQAQSHEDTLKKVEPGDAHALSEDITAHEQRQDEVIRQLERASTAHQNYQDIQSRLKQGFAGVKQALEHYQRIKLFSDVVSGKHIGAQGKVSLEAFVQSTYLDKILAAANERLNVMSESRYMLLRSETPGKQSERTLDIDVYDAHTGKRRSTKTLSGGELFIASLSLALGLSDIVQSYAGGIQVETLFIDEGFGTLDPERLDSALRVFDKLAADSRMIGIISHVESLKERIHKHIEIERTTSGSTLKIVNT